MILNRSFKEFKFRHRNKKNQIIYTSKKVKNDDEVLNLIDNFLEEKNSFIFESVEKGKIKGRYTMEELDNDKLRIKARIPDTLQFEQWLKSFGSDVEILKPIKLRKKFIEISKELNKIYLN